VRVRLLEVVDGYSKGEHDLPKEKAIYYISKGYAVLVRQKVETATDKEATNAQLSEKLRSGN
jgi:hypothetical protein